MFSNKKFHKKNFQTNTKYLVKFLKIIKELKKSIKFIPNLLTLLLMLLLLLFLLLLCSAQTSSLKKNTSCIRAALSYMKSGYFNLQFQDAISLYKHLSAPCVERTHTLSKKTHTHTHTEQRETNRKTHVPTQPQIKRLET